jgi:hypothetical protein
MLRLAHDATGRLRVRARWTAGGYVELFEADPAAPSAAVPNPGPDVAAPTPDAPCLRLTPADARALERELLGAAMCAEHVEDLVTGRVTVGWCRADGRPVETYRLQRECVGRILRRTDVAAYLAIEPPRGWAAPPFGWPAEGWYRVADGWPVGHVSRRRGWRVVSRLAPQEGG